jgi:hypothetical protein
MTRISLPVYPITIYQMINEISTYDSPLSKNARRAIDDFENGKYEECLQKVGIASEALTNEIYAKLYKAEETPKTWEGKLSKLGNDDRDTVKYVGSLLVPIKWLRNRVTHPTFFKASEQDTYLALLSFQIALETYVKGIQKK